MLVLHIGRGKAGSTTLQRAMASNREHLLASGYVWPSSAEQTDWNHIALARAISRPASDQSAVEELVAVLHADRGKVVVSSEYLFEISAPKIGRFRATLQRDTRALDRGISIVAYVRDYGDWLLSKYSQEVRKGRWTEDFDAFFAARAPTVSARPALENWASIFGEGALRVRHLSASLSAAHLVGDFAAALGLESLVAGANANVSPHWLVVEFVRAMLRENPTLKDPPLRAVTGRFVAAVASAAAAMDVEKAVYFTAAQLDAMDEIYRKDADWLADYAGVPAPLPNGRRRSERLRCPDIADAPRDVVQTIVRAALQSPKFVRNEIVEATARRIAGLGP